MVVKRGFGGNVAERKTWMRVGWNWISHDFFKASALYFMLSMAGTLLNFVGRVVLGRMLTPAQYGEMEAMMQVVAYAGIPLAAIQMSIAREVARAKGEGKTEQIGAIIWTVGRKMAVYSMAAMAFLVIVAPWLRDFFKLNSVWPVYASSALTLSGFLSVVVIGGLQGGHRFWRVGLSCLFGPLSRIGFSWALIKPGFGATGALAANAGSGIVMSLAGLAFVWDLIKNRSREPVDLRPLYRFVGPIMLTLWVSSIIGGVDIFVVKRVFSVVEAGDYARVSATVRLALFINGVLTTAFFPWVVTEQAGGRDTGHLLVKALAAGAGIAVAAAILLSVFPAFFLGIFYTQISPVMVGWTRLLSWALIPGSLIAILIQYHMARQEYRFLRWLVPAGLLYTGMLVWFRHSVEAMIVAMGIGGALIVTGLSLLAFTSSKGSIPRERL